MTKLFDFSVKLYIKKRILLGRVGPPSWSQAPGLCPPLPHPVGETGRLVTTKIKEHIRFTKRLNIENSTLADD